MKKIYLLFISLAILSCEGNTVEYDTDNLLLGNWTQKSFNDGVVTFNRTTSLPKNSYGVAFLQDGVFKEKTSGWCGTPPITYFDMYGSYTVNEDLISIEIDAYPNYYGYQILSLDKDVLKIKREVTEQEKEYLALMELFYEIQEIAYSKQCTDSTSWQFVAYGAKACGGPQGYLPYATDIDTVSFLEKVEAYTAAEKAFNLNWNITSDCAFVNPPDGVECSNGYPILVYN